MEKKWSVDISDEEKREQLKVVMQNITEEQSVIIAGDFNCNRRSFVDVAKWNINAIDDIVSEEYNRITPKGASWARDVSTEDKYASNSRIYIGSTVLCATID